MIPQRIAVTGFLSYRERQEVDFEGGSLWMLTGPNGSGKSSLFDAVTYALFGQHRGGRKNARELVNKASDRLVVEFDFELDGVPYRAKRTLRKTGRATRQISRGTPAEGGIGEPVWEAVPDTANENGFGDWVRDHVGLTYETFTSSVLLLQGKAEKLLAAEPAERFRVLAGVVDLGRFQRLFERAEAKRRTSEAAAVNLRQQLDALSEATEEEVHAVEQRVAAAEDARGQAQAEVERLQRLGVYAERWTGLLARMAEVSAEWGRAEALFQQAGPIERAWGRLTALRAALPHLKAVVESRARVAESRQAVSAMERDRLQLEARIEELDGLLVQTRQKRDQRRQAIFAGECRREEVGGRLRDLAGLLALVDLCERQRTELAQLEAQGRQFPTDLGESLQQAEREFAGLSELVGALPHLRRVHEERAGICGALTTQQFEAKARGLALSQAERTASEVGDWDRRCEEAAGALAEARQRATAEQTRLQEADEELRRFEELAGAKTCRHCGQALTPAHFELEQARRRRERAVAETKSKEAAKTYREAADAERCVREERHAAADRLEALREQARQHDRQLHQACRDAERHLRACAAAYRDLAEPFRRRVGLTGPGSEERPADWQLTTYPDADDLADAGRRAADLPSLRRRCEELRALDRKQGDLQIRAAAARQAVSRLESGLPADVPALRAEYGRLADADAAVRDQLGADRTEARREEETLDRLADERKEAARTLSDTLRQLAERVVHCRALEAVIKTSIAALPDGWRAQADGVTPDHVAQWEAERDDEDREGVEAKAHELGEARRGLESLRRRKADLDRELADIPEEARCEPEELRRRVFAAKQELAARENVLAACRDDALRLADRRRQRDQLREDFRAADRRQTLYRTLADHLGRKGLQLHQVRRAERGIVDLANAVLDRLTGGRFCLCLRGGEGGEGDQALLLETLDRSSGQGYGLPFLSGSQRFRVAVSLALGIGQYASRQHRPIEAVIIDEGFGCLDREGRQVMIQELQNLRSQLRRILLVSHQEEFADAFAQGYRFELADGTTRVTRFEP
jgi:DNA repair exonuclease SbcCD ATPase subunit